MTGQQVTQQVYNLLKDSPLASFITGGVYKKGQRPRDSKLEDAVVMFVSGLDSQIQTGVVVINIFVPDITNENRLVENIKRCEQIEVEADEWVNSLTADVSDFLWRKARTIYTEQDAEINQHFVSIRLKFELFTN